MTAHRRRARVERLGEITRSAWTLAQKIDDAAPRRVGERRQDVVQIAQASSPPVRSRS